MAVTALLYAFIFAMNRFGAGLLSAAEERVPEYSLRLAQRAERSGDLPTAIAAYRKALAGGIDNPASRDDGMRRLSALLAEHGRVASYWERSAASLVQGGAFETMDDAAAWSADLTNGISLDSVEKVEGQSSFVIRGPQKRVALSQLVHVIPGKSYELSLWSRTLEGSPDATFYLAIDDEISQLFPSVPNVSISVSGRKQFIPLASIELSDVHEWRQDVKTFAATTDRAVLALIWSDANATTNADTPLWIDAISLREVQPNLLTNGNFEYGEDGLAQWVGEPRDTHIGTGTETLVEGCKALRIELANSVNLGLRQSIDVQPGARYRLEGWIRTREVGGDGACLEAQDADRGWQAFRIETAPRLKGTNDWQHVSVDIDVPVETKTLSVLLRRPSGNNSNSGQGVIWFDACSFVRLPDAVR